MEEMLIEKVRQRTFLCDAKSPDYRDQHMRANVWKGTGKELKIKRKFYVSSRDVRIVCPRLMMLRVLLGCEGQCNIEFYGADSHLSLCLRHVISRDVSRVTEV